MQMPTLFSLIKIETKQFAIIEQSYSLSKSENIEIQMTLPFGIDENNRVVTSIASFNFNQESSTFIAVEVNCAFQIQPESWDQLLNEEKTILQIPKEVLVHFAMLCVGTTRGVLHAKTENTEFNKFFLPTINIIDIIKDDIIFPLSVSLSN